MKLFCLSLLVGCMVTTLGAMGAGEWRYDKPVAPLACGEALDWRWKAGDDFRKGERVYLTFEARIDAPGYTSGAADGLVVWVNRVPVLANRLQNKQIHWIHGRSTWSRWDGNGNNLRLLYHRWNDEKPELGRIHRYTFDITDLLDEQNAAEVRLASVFSAVENARVEVRELPLLSGAEVKKAPFPAGSTGFYLSEGLNPWRKKASSLHQGVRVVLDSEPDYQAREVSVDASAPAPKQTVPVRASDKGTIGLEVPDFPVEAVLHVGLPGSGWKVLDHDWRRTENGLLVYDDGRLKIERRVVSSPYGAEVRDRFVNLTGNDLPVGVLYEIALGDIARLQEFRLLGRKQAMFYANTTPDRESATVANSYFRNRKGAGFGVLLEDDVFRNQASFLAWDNRFALGTDLFYLHPKGEQEFHWSVIPTGAGGYYDFLNAVREKWQTFQTIPGLFGFVYPHNRDNTLTSPEAIRRFFDETGISVPCIPPSTPFEGGNGYRMVYGNERPETIRAAFEPVSAFVKLAREGGVPHPFVVYTDVHLVRTDGDVTILKELDDSVILDERGNPVQYREGWLYNVLPTGETKAGARFAENLRQILDTPGISGVFLDEWDHSRARITFNHHDGVTVLLDEDFNIRRKVGLVPLLVRDYQQTVWQILKEKQAVVFANQFDSVASSLKLPIVHFAEPTQYDHYFLYGAQMGRTPLALTVKRSSDPWLDVQEFLKQGVLTCFYAQRLYGDHLLRHLYPFTARQIGPGYVVGTERIVTLLSGTYTFGNDRPLRARIFGGRGGTYLRTVEAKTPENGVTRLQLTLNRDAEEVALIEVIQP